MCAQMGCNARFCVGDGIMDLAAYYLVVSHGLDFFANGTGDVFNGSIQGCNVKLTDFGHARIVRRKTEHTLLG